MNTLFFLANTKLIRKIAFGTLQTLLIIIVSPNCFFHLFAISFNFERASNVNGFAVGGHCSMWAVVSGDSPYSQVVSPMW